MDDDLAVSMEERHGMEGLAVFRGQRFRDAAQAHYDEQQSRRGQEPEDRAPTEGCEHPASEDGCHGRRQPEEERHERHEALRLDVVEEVADHRAAHHHARAHRQALHRAPRDEHVNVVRERRSQGGERVHHERGEDHRAASEAVRERAVKEEHDPEREEVRGEGLLDLERRRAE